MTSYVVGPRVVALTEFDIDVTSAEPPRESRSTDPKRAHGTASQRRSWRLIRRGVGIHWPELDEDINVDDLLAGRRSGESKASLQQWLQARSRAGRKLVRSTSAGRPPSIRKTRRG